MRRAGLLLMLSFVIGSLLSTSAVAQTDTEAPVLHALSAEPTVVSVYSGSAVATIYATIADDLSGVMHDDSPCGDICYPTGIGIYSPTGNKYGFGFVNHINGDLYAVRFRFTQYGELGTWKVEHLQLSDNAGNSIEMFETDLDAAGFLATVEVTNDPPVDHPMTASLSLTGHLYASGVVAPDDASPACSASAVTIKKRTATGSWQPVSSGVTSASGAFRIRIPDKTGRYKAVVNPSLTESGTDRCVGVESAVVRHRHT